MEKPDKVCVLYSGGVESAALLVHYLEMGTEVFPLQVLGNFPYQSIEKIWAEKLHLKLQEKYPHLHDIEYRNFQWSRHQFKEKVVRVNELFIPLRNMVLMSIAAIYMRDLNIQYVANGTMRAIISDNTVEYFMKLQELISLAGGYEPQPFQILLPFMGRNKGDIIKQYAHLVPFELSYTCVGGLAHVHCGECMKCEERRSGFKHSGVEDQTQYEKKELVC